MLGVYIFGDGVTKRVCSSSGRRPHWPSFPLLSLSLQRPLSRGRRRRVAPRRKLDANGPREAGLRGATRRQDPTTPCLSESPGDIKLQEEQTVELLLSFNLVLLFLLINVEQGVSEERGLMMRRAEALWVKREEQGQWFPLAGDPFVSEVSVSGKKLSVSVPWGITQWGDFS